MKIIQLTNHHQKKHFDHFIKMDQPHFNLVANVDITDFLSIIKSKKWPFTPSMVYVLARIANEIPVFKRRIRGKKIIEHSSVQPSFSVPTDVSEVFSFCTVTYDVNPAVFIENALAEIERMKTNPIFEDEDGRDDFLFMSAIPWVSFTSMMHPMHYSPVDSVPRITWGKYFEQNGRIMMPLGVQAHHALVDGSDMGAYFMKVQALLDGMKF